MRIRRCFSLHIIIKITSHSYFPSLRHCHEHRMLPKSQVLSRCQLSINQSSFGCVLLKYFGEQTCTKMGHFLAGELEDKFKETKMI